MNTTLAFSLVAVIFFLLGTVVLHNTLFWSFCFALTSAGGILFAILGIARFSFAVSKLQALQNKNAPSKEINQWLFDQLLSKDVGEAKFLVGPLAIPIVMLSYRYIRWETESLPGHVFQFIVYVIIGSIPAVFGVTGMDRAQSKLKETVESDPKLNEDWQSWKLSRVSELLNQLIQTEDIPKQTSIGQELRSFGILALLPTLELIRKSEEPKRSRLARALVEVAGKDYAGDDDRKLVVEGLLEILKGSNLALMFRAMRRLNQVDNIWITNPVAQELTPHLIRTNFEMTSATPQDEADRKMLQEVLSIMNPNWLNSEVAKQCINKALTTLMKPRPPSIGDLLAASISQLHRQTQEKFAGTLQQIAPGIHDPFSVKDSVAPALNITWDNSEELREASKCASNPPTREDGMAKLKGLCETHPSSSAPYALLAQAMDQNHQQAEAETLLLSALAKVHTKS